MGIRPQNPKVYGCWICYPGRTKRPTMLCLSFGGRNRGLFLQQLTFTQHFPFAAVLGMGEWDSTRAQSRSDNSIVLAIIFIITMYCTVSISTLVHCSNSYLLGNCYVLCTIVLYPLTILSIVNFMDSFLVTLLLLGWDTTETKATYKRNIDQGSRF